METEEPKVWAIQHDDKERINSSISSKCLNDFPFKFKMKNKSLNPMDDVVPIFKFVLGISSAKHQTPSHHNNNNQIKERPNTLVGVQSRLDAPISFLMN